MLFYECCKKNTVKKRKETKRKMETKNLTCIGCPLGCAITVELENGVAASVTGNTCARGDAYARKEVTHPTRTVTSTVRVNGGEIAVASCKTARDIPKEKIMDVMACIKKISADAPVHIGDILLENAAGTNVSILATKDVAAAPRGCN